MVDDDTRMLVAFPAVRLAIIGQDVALEDFFSELASLAEQGSGTPATHVVAYNAGSRTLRVLRVENNIGMAVHYSVREAPAPGGARTVILQPIVAWKRQSGGSQVDAMRREDVAAPLGDIRTYLTGLAARVTGQP